MNVRERIGLSGRWALSFLALLGFIESCGGRTLADNPTSVTGAAAGETGTGGAAGGVSTTGAAGSEHLAGASGVNSLEGELLLPQQVDWLWVDAKRIYWLADPDKFESCDKADCPNTIVSYGPDTIFPALSLDHVYWWKQGSDSTLLTCPSSGCTGQPKEVGGIFKDSTLLGTDGTHVYWHNRADILKCPFSGCVGGASQIASDVLASIAGFQVSGPDAFWYDAQGVKTTHTSGDSEHASIVNRVVTVGALAVAGPMAYWVENKTQLVSCPVSGCSTDTKTLATLQSDAGAYLYADGNGLYWKQDLAVHFCALPECSNPRTITTADVVSFAVDDQYVYWNQSGATGTGLAANIRRTAKPTR